MGRAFEGIQQLLDIVIAQACGQFELSRHHDERLAHRPLPYRQSQPQKVVNRFLEGCARLPAFFIEQPGNVVIEGESGSHIMMLL